MTSPTCCSIRGFLVLGLLATLFATGCTAAELGVCGAGSQLELDGERYCVYAPARGDPGRYDCPDAVPYRIVVAGGGIVCADRDLHAEDLPAAVCAGAGADACRAQDADAGLDASRDATTDAETRADAGIDAAADGSAGTDLGTGPDTGARTDAGIDAARDGGGGTDAGIDTGTDARTDTGADAATDAGPDAGADAGTDAGADAGTAATDSGPDASDAGADASDAGADEVCNYLDDDEDGLVDEGHTYVEVPGSRTVISTSRLTTVQWSARGPDRVALAWQSGNGTPSDTIIVRLLDLAALPVGDPVSFGAYQSSSFNAPAWTGDRFLLIGAQRSYECGGASSTACTTYGVGIDRSAALLFGPSVLALDTPVIGGFVVAGGEYLVSFTPPSLGGAVRVRSFTPEGAPGAVDRTLLTSVGGERILRVAAAADETRIWWVVVSDTGGLSLRVTRLDAAPVGGPYPLAPAGTALSEPHGAPMVVRDGVLYVPMQTDGLLTVRLGRWTADGTALGVTTVSSAGISWGVGLGAEQLYSLVSDGRVFSVARVSVAGDLVQPPAPVVSGITHASLVATPTGAIVATADYGGRNIGWLRVGCP